ncbi:MAG: TPR repeat protein [Myxococcota bacterium]|jgi:TPR repeat protein
MLLSLLLAAALALPPSASLADQCAYGDQAACDGSTPLPLPDLRAACEAGDTEACLTAVVRLRHPPLDGRDDSWAFAQATAACEADEPRGCLNAAWLHREGRATPGDLNQSFSLYSQACSAGALLGCCEVAGAQRWGQGTPLNPAASVATYQAACEAGAACGCSGVARRQNEGRGLPRSPDGALTTWEGQCAAGRPESCALIGNRLASSEDEAEAERGHMLWASACDGGVNWACQKGLEDDDLEGHRSLCDAGYAPACTALGAALESDHPDESLALRQQACDMGHASGCVRAGVYLGEQSPEEGPVDPRTLELYARAASMGDLAAALYLGRRYRNGDGVEADAATATAWLEPACARERIDACLELARMHRDGDLDPPTVAAGAARLAAPCDAGNMYACERWGRFLTPSRSDPGFGDPDGFDPAATDALRRACDADRSEACFALAIRLHLPAFGAFDEAGAFDAARKACDADHAAACDHVAWHWDHGTTEVDREAAAAALSKACDLGRTGACKHLELRPALLLLDAWVPQWR